ncbi:hypothetical protein Mal64_25020 [Pseudobythopirellula maris]|uniref:Uncharacterized protein n=1 Tax=Pseudobythopirellula maris TaxID=2527991 RepID=A0A5C5ZQB4_9BACT|nr:hypothetical protein [Pseudobythopirellula maris]TWT89011.1 hypothetical protein Mal64_25020 [Pseudobythopirellula maris]
MNARPHSQGPRWRSPLRRQSVAGILALAAFTAAGCGDNPPASNNLAVELLETEELTPEQSFKNIVEAVKRQVDNRGLRDAMSLGMSSTVPGEPMTDWNTTIEHDFTPPASEGEPYRGSVTFNTVSKTVFINTGSSDGSGEEAEAASESSSPLSQMGSSSSPYRELKDQTSQRYEFEYRGSRWELVSEVDEENKPFDAGVLESALMKQ